MIFDGHGDIWTDVACRRLAGEKDVFRRRHLEKYRQGQIGGSIFVIWIDPPHTGRPGQRFAEVVDCMRQELAEAADVLHPVTRYAGLAEGEQSGKINVVIGMEGLSPLGEDLDRLDELYREVGVRHAMLTWNESNALATGTNQDPGRGLTRLGRKAVRRIQDLGMVLDVSHLNDKSFREVMDVAQGPVIASHSNARALCPAPRNLDDAMLKTLAATGGLVGVNSLKEFIDTDPARQTVDRLADHVDHMVGLMGVDHVALGYDFDDYLDAASLSAFTANVDSPSAAGVANASEAANLLGVLRRRGYSREELDKIAFGNFYRVFRSVWR